MDTPLTKQEQAILLRIARDSITSYLRTGIIPDEPREEKALNQRRGCFVTLMQEEQLRGCLGTFQSERPLFREVAAMAAASATEDPRFYPLKEEDLDTFRIEISVLSDLQKADDPTDIVVGQHGIYLEKDYQRGVLLPQVAVEHNWDRLTFLQQTCSKAGLPKDAWQAQDCEIYLFTAQVLKEG